MQTMARIALFLVSMALALWAAGCSRGAARRGVSDSTFVATMVALDLIGTDGTEDSVAKAAARRRVLQERGLSVGELERAARDYASDPQRAARIFGRIDSVVERRRRLAH
jgi:hypothetical protein